jgi:hypothetical protein
LVDKTKVDKPTPIPVSVLFITAPRLSSRTDADFMSAGRIEAYWLNPDFLVGPTVNGPFPDDANHAL